jgi:hypothetical protein
MLLKWLYPYDYNFEPETFIYPEQSEKLSKYMKENPDLYYIVKPSSASCGYGITLAHR